MKIKVKLLGGFLLVVLCIIALSFYSADTGQRSLEESIGKNTVFLAEEMLAKMDQSIFFNIETLQRATKAFLLQKFISESNREFERLKSISEYIDKKDRAWVAAPKDEITPFMQELSDNELSDSLRRKFIEFYFKKRGARMFPEVLVTNKYGVIVALTGKTANYRQDDKKWWQAAKEKGVYVGDVEYAERVGTNVIPLGIRVDDQEGNLIGVMKALVKSEEIIRRSVITTKKFDTTQIKLLTKNGKLLYSTKAFRFLEKVSEKEFFKKIKTGNNFFISVEGGKEWLFSYAHSRGYGNFEGLGWILVVGHEVDEVLKSSIELRNNLVVAFLILIAAVIIIAILISRSITKPITILTKGVEIIDKGDLEHRVEIKTKDEIGSLGTAFNSMVGNLQKASLESERHNFINTGQSELDDHMRGDQPIDELCNNIMAFIANYLKVQVGTLYVNDSEGLFKLKATYAYKIHKNLVSEFKTGEGLIGQAAQEKRSKVLTNVPEDYITVISGLGERKPRNILVVPFVYNETVSGVLEVGSFDDFSELQTTFLEEISERIAIAINSAQSRVELGEALKKSQGQAEEMESQQEELRAANEELEEQTQRLQASEEQLKTQQEELQSLNEELEEKTQRLQASEEHFVAIMEQSLFAIQIMTTDGRIVRVNDAYKKLWGITLEDLSEYNILQDEQAKNLGLMPYIERGFAGETLSLPPFEYDPVKTVEKGKKRWIQSHIYPVKDKSGEIRNVIMMHEDISERKEREE